MTIEVMLVVPLIGLVAAGLAGIFLRRLRPAPALSTLTGDRRTGDILTSKGRSTNGERIDQRPHLDAPTLSVGPELRRRLGAGGSFYP